MPPDLEGAARLVLVRHGETTGQSSIRYYGRTDVPLSAEGRDQMMAAAAALADVSFTRVFTSRRTRSIEGARLIAGAEAPRLELAEFDEIDFGHFEGLTQEEIRAQLPADYARWHTSRLESGYRYPGGESRRAFNARVTEGLERMLGAWREGPNGYRGNALMVAHRGVLRVIIQTLAPEAEPEIALASIHVLGFNSGRWECHALDQTGHLKH